MNNSERDIAFYEIVFRPSAPTATPNHQPEDVFQKFADAVGSEHSSKTIKINGTDHKIELLAFAPKYTPDFAIGYVGISDSTVPIPARRNRETKQIKFAPKAAEEDDEFGCHIFIRRAAEPNGKHKFYLERMTKLGASNIQVLLRHVLSSQHEAEKGLGGAGLFSGPHKTGKNVDVGYNIVVDLVGIPSDKAASIVNQRRITGITLVSENKKTPFGGKPYLTAGKQDIRVGFDLKAASNIQDLFSDLKTAFKSESARWKTARIQFDSPSEGRGSISLDTVTGSVIEDRFVKKITLSGIRPQLASSAGKIVGHFAVKVMGHPQIK